MTGTNWREAVVAYIRAEAQPVDKFGHRPRDPVELAGWDHVPYTIARADGCAV
jgi:hypothetical protein